MQLEVSCRTTDAKENEAYNPASVIGDDGVISLGETGEGAEGSYIANNNDYEREVVEIKKDGTIVYGEYIVPGTSKSFDVEIESSGDAAPEIELIELQAPGKEMILDEAGTKYDEAAGKITISAGQGGNGTESG